MSADLSIRNLGFVAVVASLGGLIFGFDMAVISGVLPLFKAQYGLDAALEGWFVSSALVGCVIGVLLSSFISDRLGRKPTMLLAALLFVVSTLACASLVQFSHIIFGRILTGIGIGIASNVVPLYLSEIAPTKDRGKLVTLYQLAVTLGIVLAYVSNAFIIQGESNYSAPEVSNFLTYLFLEESWRGMIVVAVLPSLLFALGILFIPESPAWNVSLKRTSNYDFKEVFERKYRKALIISLFLPIFSQLCGINVIIYYGPSILNDLGFSLGNSMYGQIIIGIANMLFTMVAIWKVDTLGRRPLYRIGTLGGAIALFFTGFLFYLQSANAALLLVSVVCFLACFAFSIGPLKFVVVSELFQSHIRAKAMGLSILAMWVSDAFMGQITPMLIDGLGVHITFGLLGLVCLVGFFFINRNLPETKGKTINEIQALLSNK